MPSRKPPYVYTHVRTFFTDDRWAVYEFVGELLAQGVTHVGTGYENNEWIVVWQDHSPPKLFPKMNP